MQGIYTAHNAPQKPSEASTEASVERITEEHVAADFANLLAPLIDPAKLDTLKGNEPLHRDCVKPVTGSRWLIYGALISVRSLIEYTAQ